MSIGDVVMLKSGGMAMTIEGERDCGRIVECVWFEGGTLHRNAFDYHDLILVAPEEAAKLRALSATPMFMVQSGPQSSAPSAQSGGLMQALVECSCWLDNNLAGKNLTEGRRACPIHRDAFLALEARRLQEAEGLAKQLGAIIHYDRVRPSFREANAGRGRQYSQDAIDHACEAQLRPTLITGHLPNERVSAEQRIAVRKAVFNAIGRGTVTVDELPPRTCSLCQQEIRGGHCRCV